MRRPGVFVCCTLLAACSAFSSKEPPALDGALVDGGVEASLVEASAPSDGMDASTGDPGLPTDGEFCRKKRMAAVVLACADFEVKPTPGWQDNVDPDLTHHSSLTLDGQGSFGMEPGVLRAHVDLRGLVSTGVSGYARIQRTIPALQASHTMHVELAMLLNVANELNGNVRTQILAFDAGNAGEQYKLAVTYDSVAKKYGVERSGPGEQIFSQVLAPTLGVAEPIRLDLSVVRGAGTDCKIVVNVNGTSSGAGTITVGSVDPWSIEVGPRLDGPKQSTDPALDDLAITVTSP